MSLAKLSNRRNTLLRYREIAKVWSCKKQSDIPTTRIHRVHIYPRFFISYRTLATIIGTPIEKELREIESKIKKLDEVE